MSKPAPIEKKAKAVKALLKSELEKGLASGLSKRSPRQIRDEFRKSRAAA